MAKSLSVILPIHNQADHVEKMVAEAVEALDRLPVDYELLLVTNACRDDSPAICSAMAQANPRIVHIDSKPGGWGLAVKLGLSAAKGDLLCYTNSARTSPEVLVLTVLYAVAFPNVVVKVSRKVRESWYRRMGSLLYNLECRALFDLPTWDINGTPKVFPREFDKLLALSQPDDLIDAEFNAICRRSNYPILEVPIISTRRHSGRSTTNMRSAARMYVGAFKLWQNLKQVQV